MVSQDKLEKRITRLVAAFVEHTWPHLERQGGTPDEPMQTAKGSTNPPFGDYAHKIIDANLTASDYFHWPLETTNNSKVISSSGIYYSQILRDVRDNAGILQTWRHLNAGKNDYHDSFWEMCRHVAKGVMFMHGRTPKERKQLQERLDAPDLIKNEDGIYTYNPEALVVRVRPEDEQERAQTRDAQKADTMYTNRVIIEMLEEVESEGFVGKDAMEVLQDRRERQGKEAWSIPRMKRARTEVNKERAGEDAA